MGARGPKRQNTTITYHPSEQNRHGVLAYHQHLLDRGEGGSLNSTLDSLVAVGLSQNPTATALAAARLRAYNATVLWVYSRFKEFLKGVLADLMQMERERAAVTSHACPACSHPAGPSCPACGHQEESL